jgi:uncharacterized protein (DUF2249 family)
MDHRLDVSNLPPPEPLERTLDALAELPAGDRLLLCHRRQPFPLYDLLRRMGYRWQVSGQEGDWQILIEPEPEPERSEPPP